MKLLKILIESQAQNTQFNRQIFIASLINLEWQFTLEIVNILTKNENATLQLSIFYDKVLDKNYLLKLNNVAQTSSKRFVETPPIGLV